MSSSRWQTISQIFEAALDLPAGERESFVHKACNGDPGIEAEVIRLLAGDENAGSFLEHPALSTLPARTTPRSSILLSEGLIVGDRFRIVRFIGQGGMGQVHEALDLELNSRIALKVIRPEIAVDERMLSRFRREVQLTRMITHPNVCRTFDIERQPIPAETGGDAKSLSFLTMELLEGETLSSLLRRRGRMSVNEALVLADQTIDGLAAAHAVGVIHRDFKPSNVLLVPAGATRTASGSGASSSRLIASGSPGSSSGPALRAVVTDFGLARIVTSDISEHETGSVAHSTSLTGDQALMGTLVYMAPEQFERGEVSMASDIYSLGLVLFEMVTGQRPFADDIPFAEATKRLKQPAPLPSSLVPEIPATWEWEDGDQFVFLQIAGLYQYTSHLKRKPSWSTVRDWRKAYLGHLRHNTRDGRKPKQ
jgi:serine/threonine protein kinase